MLWIGSAADYPYRVGGPVKVGLGSSLILQMNMPGIDREKEIRKERDWGGGGGGGLEIEGARPTCKRYNRSR